MYFKSQVFLTILIAGCAISTQAQVTQTGAPTVLDEQFSNPQHLPYSAAFRITSRLMQPSGGGSATRESTEIVAVDSQGRHLVVRTITLGSGENQRRMLEYTLHDPVAHTVATWSVPGKRAIVTSQPVSPAGVLCTPNPAQIASSSLSPGSGSVRRRAMQQASSWQQLGTQIIAGVEAQGKRRDLPPGPVPTASKASNSHEVWTASAPGLAGLVVREVFDGSVTRELVSFSQSEPDPAMFQVPDGYELETRSGPESSCSAVSGSATAASSPAN